MQKSTLCKTTENEIGLTCDEISEMLIGGGMRNTYIRDWLCAKIVIRVETSVT